MTFKCLWNNETCWYFDRTRFSQNLFYIGIRIAARRVYGGNGSIGWSSEAPLYLQYKLPPIPCLPSLIFLPFITPQSCKDKPTWMFHSASVSQNTSVRSMQQACKQGSRSAQFSPQSMTYYEGNSPTKKTFFLGLWPKLRTPPTHPYGRGVYSPLYQYICTYKKLPGFYKKLGTRPIL